MDRSANEPTRGPLEELAASFSDEELAAYALAADRDQRLADDAQPWQPDGTHLTLLPEWYMPYPIATGRRTIIKVIAVSMVIGLVIICAFGLCVTSGFVQVP